MKDAGGQCSVEMEDQRATPKHYSNATTSHPGSREGEGTRQTAAVWGLRMTGCNLT